MRSRWGYRGREFSKQCKAGVVQRKRRLPVALPALEAGGLAACCARARERSARRAGPGQAGARDSTLKATACLRAGCAGEEGISVMRVRNGWM